MDRKIRKKTRQYFRRVRIFLPVYGKDEKQFVRNLRNDMEEYIDAHPSCSWKDICDEFETPYEAVYGYLSAFPAEDLCRSIRSRKRIRVVLIIVLILSALIFTLKTYQYYLMCEDSKDNIVVYYQEVIE
ncbi:MAG: DUF6120 family protein [Anaerovoracaceae bacterium]